MKFVILWIKKPSQFELSNKQNAKKKLDPTILKLKVKEKSFPLKICILSPCLYKSQSSDLLYLKNALLNVLSAINYVANDQDQGNDGEGDQGGVA